MIWNELIAAYLFLAGMGAGAFALGALAGWAKTPAPTMKLLGFIIGPVAVAVGTLLLVFDAHAGLANPGRFFLLVTNLNSVMAWGVIILSVFIVVTVVDAVLLLVKKSTPKALDVAGVVLAVCVATYTGVLLGDASVAFPLWHPVVLPVLCIVSAASTGFAAVRLITHLSAPTEVHALPLLEKTGKILPMVEAVLVVVLLVAVSATGGAGAGAAAASVANLLSGSYAVAFWLGFVVVGLALPFALEMVRAQKAKPVAVAAAADVAGAAGGEGAEGVFQDAAETLGGSTAPVTSAAPAADSGKTLAIVGDAGVLVGGFMLRYLVIMAAIPVALAL